SRLQFVRFDTGQDITRPLAELAEALRQDLDWIREHTRLGELAKAWMAASGVAAPEITDAQRAFIKASEGAETTRLAKERAQLKRTPPQQGRTAWLVAAVALLVLATAGYVTWQSYEVARREINVFTARATDAMHDEQFDRAMRYALQAYPARGRLPWITPFS